MLKRCKWCGKEFETSRKAKDFCSMDCQIRHKTVKQCIISRAKRLAEKNGWDIQNLDKITRAKLMMFKKGDHWKCPCDAQNPERYCGSYLCKNDVITKGHCHCNLFHKRNPS